MSVFSLPGPITSKRSKKKVPPHNHYSILLHNNMQWFLGGTSLFKAFFAIILKILYHLPCEI